MAAGQREKPILTKSSGRFQVGPVFAYSDDLDSTNVIPEEPDREEDRERGLEVQEQGRRHAGELVEPRRSSTGPTTVTDSTIPRSSGMSARVSPHVTHERHAPSSSTSWGEGPAEALSRAIKRPLESQNAAGEFLEHIDWDEVSRRYRDLDRR